MRSQKILITRDEPGKPVSTETAKKGWEHDNKNYEFRKISIENNKDEKLIHDAKRLVDIPMNKWGEIKDSEAVMYTGAVGNCITIIAYNHNKKFATLAHLNGAKSVEISDNPQENTKVVFNKMVFLINTLVDKTLDKPDSTDEVSVILFKGSSFTKGKITETSITENLSDFVVSEFKDREHLNFINLMDTEARRGDIYKAVMFDPKDGVLHLISSEKDEGDYFEKLYAWNPSLKIIKSETEIAELFPRTVKKEETTFEVSDTDTDSPEAQEDIFSGMQISDSSSLSETNVSPKDELKPEVDLFAGMQMEDEFSKSTSETEISYGKQEEDLFAGMQISSQSPPSVIEVKKSSETELSKLNIFTENEEKMKSETTKDKDKNKNKDKDKDKDKDNYEVINKKK